jgi:hypothetical protein
VRGQQLHRLDVTRTQPARMFFDNAARVDEWKDRHGRWSMIAGSTD